MSTKLKVNYLLCSRSSKKSGSIPRSSDSGERSGSSGSTGSRRTASWPPTASNGSSERCSEVPRRVRETPASKTGGLAEAGARARLLQAGAVMLLMTQQNNLEVRAARTSREVVADNLYHETFWCLFELFLREAQLTRSHKFVEL